MKGGKRIEIVSAEATEVDDGIAMAMLLAARELTEIKERIEALVNAHAMRRGVTLATE